MKEVIAMKQLHFKRLCLCIVFSLSLGLASAQVDESTDSLYQEELLELSYHPALPDSALTSHTLMYRYDRRVNRYRRAFSSLIPTNMLMQFYGDMGLVSMGVGWDYGKRGEWETDLLLGVIPKYNSSETKMTLTLKQTYTPWSFYLGSHFSLEPLTCGLYFNTVFSEHFWTKEPERYPSGYYGFSTRIRSHIFLGQGLTYEIPHNRRLFTKAVTAFYEISSCDIYIISAFGNSYLRPSDYLKLSFGLKFQIF